MASSTVVGSATQTGTPAASRASTSAVLFTVGQHHLGAQGDDTLDFGVLGAAYPLLGRDLVGGVNAEARVAHERVAQPQREKCFGGAGHQADQPFGDFDGIKAFAAYITEWHGIPPDCVSSKPVAESILGLKKRVILSGRISENSRTVREIMQRHEEHKKYIFLIFLHVLCLSV